MNELSLKKQLTKLNLGEIRYFDSIGSTNDEALAWAASDAPDLSLVVADEQTSGRGRLNRTWRTPPGTSLAASLILRPTDAQRAYASRMAGLAALAIADALTLRGLDAQIKWPNDVLLGGEKVAGILVESVWMGDHADAAILGMGVNVQQAAVPPAETLRFPAASVEKYLRCAPDRVKLLYDILASIRAWLPRMDAPSFIKAWEEKLAFRGETVYIYEDEQVSRSGILTGLESDGSLRLRGADGNFIAIRAGDVSLRAGA
ncbi:MAG: biotin--[acetyl-CoA-carboxylase] ligase [Anaerolineales bacterium]